MSERKTLEIYALMAKRLDAMGKPGAAKNVRQAISAIRKGHAQIGTILTMFHTIMDDGSKQALKPTPNGASELDVDKGGDVK